MKSRVATCACGQLQVTCRGEPRKVSLCHCLDCQKRTGSAYGIAAFYLRENVDAEGDAGVDAGQDARSGDGGGASGRRAIGFVEQFDYMKDPLALAMAFYAGAQLQHATGIGGGKN